MIETKNITLLNYTTGQIGDDAEGFEITFHMSYLGVESYHCLKVLCQTIARLHLEDNVVTKLDFPKITRQISLDQIDATVPDESVEDLDLDDKLKIMIINTLLTFDHY
jgi:hypothetical protein